MEMRSEQDAEYALRVLALTRLYGRALKLNKSGRDKQSLDVGARLFIGNLDPECDDRMLHDTFAAFGYLVGAPKVMRDEQGRSRGFGFVAFDSFEAADMAIETMNGQFLCNQQISVAYAFKKEGGAGEKHGDSTERLLAASQRIRQHTNNVPSQGGAMSAIGSQPGGRSGNQ